MIELPFIECKKPIEGLFVVEDVFITKRIDWGDKECAFQRRTTALVKGTPPKVGPYPDNSVEYFVVSVRPATIEDIPKVLVLNYSHPAAWSDQPDSGWIPKMEKPEYFI